jgi:membrane-anchored protein YejM (alkaline phosphatase superfamily)
VLPLTTAVATVVTGAAVMLAGLVLSVWSSQRRRAVRQEATSLRMDPGLVVAFIGAVALIYGLGDVVFLLLTLG